MEMKSYESYSKMLHSYSKSIDEGVTIHRITGRYTSWHVDLFQYI
jgi:hypothetical protein